MHAIKYIVCYLLLLLTFSTSKADSLYHYYLTLNIDGSAISDTFYIDYIGDEGLKFLFDAENPSDDFVLDRKKFYIYDAKTDSVDILERLNNGILATFPVSTHTGKLTDKTKYRYRNGNRLAVYFPSAKMIYVSRDFDFQNVHNTFNVKVTGDPNEPIEFSCDYSKILKDFLTGFFLSLMIVMVPLPVLKFFRFQPDLRSKITTFVCCVLLWCLSNYLFIKVDAMVALLLFALIVCGLVPFILGILRILLKIELGYSLFMSIIMVFAIYFIAICSM